MTNLNILYFNKYTWFFSKIKRLVNFLVHCTLCKTTPWEKILSLSCQTDIFKICVQYLFSFLFLCKQSSCFSKYFLQNLLLGLTSFCYIVFIITSVIIASWLKFSIVRSGPGFCYQRHTLELVDLFLMFLICIVVMLFEGWSALQSSIAIMISG